MLVLVPAGKFRMGSDVGGGAPDEGPAHDVSIEAFLISKYEMTQGQWATLAKKEGHEKENPSTHVLGDPNDFRKPWLHPVETVSWEDCRELLVPWGLGLPSEGEWEYAARAGTTTRWWTGELAASLEGAANVADQYLKTHGGQESWAYESWSDEHAVHAPIGSFRPNAFGLHDVAGNVYEWCLDSYEYSYKDAPIDGSARVSARASARVARGGGWFFTAGSARSAHRHAVSPADADADLGVRPARGVSRLAPSPLHQSDEPGSQR